MNTSPLKAFELSSSADLKICTEVNEASYVMRV